MYQDVYMCKRVHVDALFRVNILQLQPLCGYLKSGFKEKPNVTPLPSSVAVCLSESIKTKTWLGWTIRSERVCDVSVVRSIFLALTHTLLRPDLIIANECFFTFPQERL